MQMHFDKYNSLFYICEVGYVIFLFILDELHLSDCISLPISSNIARNPGSAICYSKFDFLFVSLLIYTRRGCSLFTCLL